MSSGNCLQRHGVSFMASASLCAGVCVCEMLSVFKCECVSEIEEGVGWVTKCVTGKEGEAHSPKHSIRS